MNNVQQANSNQIKFQEKQTEAELWRKNFVELRQQLPNTLRKRHNE